MCRFPIKHWKKKREVNHFIWEQKSKEEHLPKQQKSKILVRKDTVYVNRLAVKHKLPKVKFPLLYKDPAIQDEIDNLVTFRSDLKTVKDSIFQAFAAYANTTEEAHKVQTRIRQANPAASHVIAAFVSGTGDYAFNEDGEFGSGIRLVRKIKERDFADVVVCIVHKFGGKHIGPQRFQIINDLAIQAIERLS